MARPAYESYDATARRKVAQALQSRASGRWRSFNFGLALVVITLAFVAGSAWFTLEDIRKQSEAAAGEVLKNLKGADYDAIYNSCTTTGFRESTTREQFWEAMRTVRSKLGALVSQRPSEFHYGVFTHEANLAYEAKFERGRAQVVATMTRVSGKWLLVRLRVDPATP